MSPIGDKDLETISLGIDGIEKLYKREMRLEQFADLQAKVHFTLARLEKLETAGSNRIKTGLLEDNKSIVEGNLWMIQVNPVTVFRLDTAKVKKFLGKQLRRFGSSQIEYRLKYISRGK